MHKRELTAALHRTYAWHASLPERGDVPWPSYVRRELLGVGLLLLVAETSLRDPVSPVVSCTDATPTSGGAVSCVVRPELAEFMHDFGERRGERTRLDWGVNHLEVFPTSMQVPQAFTREVLAQAFWKVTRSRSLPSRHINIQEMEEIREELVQRAQMSLSPCRVANIIDSRVCLGAFAKGRSSSQHLNVVLRSTIGHRVLGRKSLVNTWAMSEENPGDDPSRFATLRSPVEGTADVGPLCQLRLDLLGPACSILFNVRGVRRSRAEIRQGSCSLLQHLVCVKRLRLIASSGRVKSLRVQGA